jgi:hypothetical protein
MFLPIRLVWNLQMERVEKTGIIILFCGGFVCIAFSSLRVFKVGMRNSDAVAPNAKWLTLWTIIEVSIGMFTPLLGESSAVITDRGLSCHYRLFAGLCLPYPL